MALENKLGIDNSADLAREEERISKKKAVALFETGLLDQLEAGKQFTNIFLRLFTILPVRSAS